MPSTTTDFPTMPEPEEPRPDRAGDKRLLVTVLVALLVVLGIKVLVAYWWRKGGPRRVLTELAEDSAVKLADALIDEVLPAA
jgi:hypothetical protein